MIKINKLCFSNVFSYGEGNVINFSDKVTQLVGKNGAGKSSIPTILEEGLFNKNSRGIKKGDILNKFLDAKEYKISIEFIVGNHSYLVDKVVSSSAKVKLFKGVEDISGHTTTQTYKLIEDIIGADFTTFTKLVYQSMASSLDFISATDSNRKKFLISLLGLEAYVANEGELKRALKAKTEEVQNLRGSVDTANSWIKSQGNIGIKVTPQDVPELDVSDLEKEKGYLMADSIDVQRTNKGITTNNGYKKELDSLIEVPKAEGEVCSPNKLLAEVMEVKSEIAVLTSEYTKLSLVKDKCPTCGSPVDIQDTLDRLVALGKSKLVLKDKLAEVEARLLVLREHNDKISKYKTYISAKNKLEKLYDPSFCTEQVSQEGLLTSIKLIESKIKQKKDEHKELEREYSATMEANRLIEYKESQLQKYTEELSKYSDTLKEASLTKDRLAVLTDSLGNKGLIAYKIESMVKSFETLINEYLQELSDGMFTLKFIMDDTKLQIVIHSNSVEMDIKSVSSGEFNKINTATLLAVRKMLSSVSKVDINLLFLDEVVSVLDPESKDTLVELLLREDNLNTVVVSHGYTHPLAEKLSVVKTNKISRIVDNG